MIWPPVINQLLPFFSTIILNYILPHPQCCGSGRLLSGSGSDIEVRILNKQNWIFLILTIIFSLLKTFYLEFVVLKFRLFCFIHSFLFLIQSLLVIFQKIFFFMTFYGWIRSRIRTIWPDQAPDLAKRFGSDRIRLRNTALPPPFIFVLAVDLCWYVDVGVYNFR